MRKAVNKILPTHFWRQRYGKQTWRMYYA